MTSMSARNLNSGPALTALCLCFVLLISAESEESSCPGPLSYYEEIGCTPVFMTPESKCAEKYNCDDLKKLLVDKCVINGHTYEIGEELREEDRNPCDIRCSCTQGTKGPEFTCDVVQCQWIDWKYIPGCYQKRNGTDCCPHGFAICERRDEDRATCIVDGKTYRDGELFKPAAEPEKNCYCGQGYTGENVAPFCASPKNSWCRTMLHRANEIRENCAPTYNLTQSPKTSCSEEFRCQNVRDVVISEMPDSSEESKAANALADPDMQCKFGNLTMNVGDELNHGTYYDSVCMSCICEVPPVPTCQRLSDEECHATKDLNFVNSQSVE